MFIQHDRTIQFLQQYEKKRAELMKMNWERSVRGWGVVGDTSPFNLVTWKDVEEEIRVRLVARRGG